MPACELCLGLQQSQRAKPFGKDDQGAALCLPGYHRDGFVWPTPPRRDSCAAPCRQPAKKCPPQRPAVWPVSLARQYPIYRQLSRFKAAQWPLLCSQLENQTPADSPKLAEVVARARDMLELADRRRDEAGNDALEVELEVLRKLLDRRG